MKGKSGSRLLSIVIAVLLAAGAAAYLRSNKTPSATAPPKPESSPTQRIFWDSDTSNHTSPWYKGAHRIMIGFGCTPAPYYKHDPACPGKQGSHHGIDINMPCNNPLYSNVNGTIVDPKSPGDPGPAYGNWAFRIRTVDAQGKTRDIVIGHVRTVYVKPGQRVKPGQKIALASNQGAPDGCHLHFETRSRGGGVATAVDPSDLLKLSSK